MNLSPKSLLMAAATLLAAGVHAEDKARTPWPSPVPGFVAPQPGEHPRLLFRKADLPAIKARAETPEGRKLVERLKATLGGGEAMPAVYNKAKRAYDSQPELPERPSISALQIIRTQ